MVYLNGRFVPESEAVVSVFDRCFLYGDGLFETMRLYQGRPFRWRQHFERLQEGASLLGIAIPYTMDLLARASRELWVRNDSPIDALVRLTLSRGVGARGYAPESAIHPSLVMALHAIAPVTGAEILKVITSSLVVPSGDPLSKYKTCNKLQHVMARAQAAQAGAQEALILNDKGGVAEASGSNIFLIRTEMLKTPSLASGALAGITREVVIELAGELGMQAVEGEVIPTDLQAADGIFLSNSGRGLMEIGELDGKPVPRSAWVQQLQNAYQERVKMELALDGP